MTKFMCKNSLPALLNIPGGGLDMPAFRSRQQKEKVVVVVGATGAGKSKLSIDIATRFPSEIVNSDKMQVYHGLDIVTNKITEKERRDIPHHLLGTIDPDMDFPVSSFCSAASLAIKSIISRHRLPVIAGGSNSFIEALVDENRYECCFIWVDVAIPVLDPILSNRVDKMVEMGMVEEVKTVFRPNCDYSKGIRRAIGVPEFDRFFRSERISERKFFLKSAIEDTKTNTRKLARRQLEKIKRLRNVRGWNLHRIDATDLFMKSGGEAEAAWEELVLEPSLAIVNSFLKGRKIGDFAGNRRAVAMEMAMAMSAVTH